MAKLFAAICLALLLTGCGYVGDPLPPALNIPEKVLDLRAVQRGGKIIVDYTIPKKTTEGLLVKRLGPADLHIGGKSFETPPDKGHFEVDAKEFAGQEAQVRIRINNGRGRYSDWSNMVMLSVIPTLEPPANIAAKSDPQGVRLTWTGPGETWRVVRLGEGNKVAVVDHPEYLDNEAPAGKEYRYHVVAVLKTAESEPSAVVAITPKDDFPPAAPAGLTALAGIDTIELSWDRNTEEDLKGYRIYRATDSGGFDLIAPLVEEPVYSDKAVMPGKKYRYAVSALDQTGNEGAKSTAIEIATPQ